MEENLQNTETMLHTKRLREQRRISRKLQTDLLTIRRQVAGKLNKAIMEQLIEIKDNLIFRSCAPIAFQLLDDLTKEDFLETIQILPLLKIVEALYISVYRKIRKLPIEERDIILEKESLLRGFKKNRFIVDLLQLRDRSVFFGDEVRDYLVFIKLLQVQDQLNLRGERY